MEIDLKTYLNVKLSIITWNTSIHIVSLSALTPNQEEGKRVISGMTSSTLDCPTDNTLWVCVSTVGQSSSTHDRVQNILYYTTVLLLVYNTFSSIPRAKSSIHDLIEVTPATLRRVILIIERPMVTFLFFIVLTCRDD